MKKLFFLLVLALGFAPMITSAQTLPDAVINAVGRLVVYEEGGEFTEEHQLLQGTATFIDHNGCFFTNSHVVMPIDEELGDEAVVWVQDERDEVAETYYRFEMMLIDESRDLAYGCLIGADDVFTNFFPRPTESGFDSRLFGEPVWVIGYPGAGLETITVSPGNIVGFSDKPDITDFIGLPDVDLEILSIYKVDSLSGSGVSGGVLLSEDWELIGMPFAGSLNPGGFLFILSDTMLIDFEAKIRRFYHVFMCDCICFRITLSH